MRFREEQRRASLESLKLITFFIFAVISIVFIMSYASVFVIHVLTKTWPYINITDKYIVYTVSSITVFIIFTGYVYHRIELRQGGVAVASMLGGVEITPSSRDVYERRLINIVNEMSIAATIPAPSVFVLDNEQSINAFAAGYSSNDYAIAVTKGALTKLTRDELQGVVAHEIGHLVNGDSSLNLHLLSVLGGLMGLSLVGKWIAEESFNHSSVSSKNDLRGLSILLGLGVWVFGMLGVFMGKFIKATISREREYYADARAIQFTRNPHGLGGALRKISGYDSKIRHYNSILLSYMFFESDNSDWMDNWFDTHPPISSRIAKIYGHPIGKIDVHTLSEQEIINEHNSGLVSSFTGLSITSSSPTNIVRTKLDRIYNDVEMYIGLLIAIVDIDNVSCSEHIYFNDSKKVLNFAQLFKPEIRNLSLYEKLLLLNLSAPVLRRLSTDVKNKIKLTLNSIINSDAKCSLEEFLFSSILYYRSSKPESVHYKSIDKSLIPLVSAFSQLSGFVAVKNFSTCMEMLGLKGEYSTTNDYSHLLNILESLIGLSAQDKVKLLNVLRVAATNDMGITDSAGNALNVIASVLEVPGYGFDPERYDLSFIDGMFK